MLRSVFTPGKNSGYFSRNSSIELLKIFAMFLIVVFHVNMSLNGSLILPSAFGFDNSLHPSSFARQIFTFFGPFGNMIFWVCSCWFLVSNDRMSCRKVFFIIADIWLISMLILIPSVMYLGAGTIGKNILYCCFPTFFANNWYMTCYLLVFAIHPLLNLIIKNFNQRSYLRFTLAITLMYSVTALLYPGKFFTNSLVIFIVVYFIVGYLKFYCRAFNNNLKLNFSLLLISIFAICAYLLFFDVLRVYYGIDNGISRIWASNENTFVVLIAISSLNIAKHFTFHSRTINYISSLTLLIYIIHENLIVREFYRVPIWKWMAQRFGTDYILVEHLCYSTILFFVAMILAAIYKSTIKQWISGIVGKVYGWLARVYMRCENRLLRD